jgi:hypothetical protein
VVTLTRLLAVFVRWLARSRRRQLAVLVLPVLGVVALLAPHGSVSPPAPSGRLAGGLGPTQDAGGGGYGGPTGGPTSPAHPSATGLPGTTGAAPGPTVSARPAVAIPAAAVRVATGYVQTANAHDARPGRDSGFLDSYLRARPYLTPQLFTLVSTPSQRGDYQWAQWQQAQATVSVQVQRVAVPDGAPLPTASTAYVRVVFRQVVTAHAAGASGGTVTGEVTLVASRSGTGGWLVSQLLAST